MSYQTQELMRADERIFRMKEKGCLRNWKEKHVWGKWSKWQRRAYVHSTPQWIRWRICKRCAKREYSYTYTKKYNVKSHKRKLR